MKPSTIAGFTLALLAAFGAGVLLSPRLNVTQTLTGQPVSLPDTPADKGLLGRPPSLEHSFFCGEYRCEPTGLDHPTETLSSQGYALQVGQDRTEVWETVSKDGPISNGQVISLRWSTDFELSPISSYLARMLRHLTRAATGADITERQIYEALNLSLLGETVSIPVGGARFQTIIEPSGSARRIHVMISGDLGEARQWEPPSTRMNADERSRMLNSLYTGLKEQNAEFGPVRNCETGLNLLSAGAFSLENLRLSQQDPLKLTYRTVQEVAHENGFTHEGVYHTRHTGTTYSLVPSTKEGLCLSVVNGLN